jgi:hypothetical protein
MRTGLAVRPDGFILADLQEALVWSLEPSDQGQLVAHQATLPRLFLEEVEALKERLAADASAGLGVRVLRSVRSTSDGGVWLPILSPKVLGLVSPNDSAEVSVLIRTTDREEHRGAVDAVLDANRLYILYLDRIDVFRIPDMDATNPEPRSTP